jgi:hypothetical protein
MKQELTTDAEILRATFEQLASDSYGFRRSRKGNYVNAAVSRDWKWFQAGYAANLAASARIAELERALCTATCQMRDLCNGWPVDELAERPIETMKRLDRLVPNNEVQRL